jgi:hypothetical protein
LICWEVVVYLHFMSKRISFTEEQIIEIFSNYNSGNFTIEELVQKWGHTSRKFFQDYMKHKLNHFEKDFIEKNNLILNKNILGNFPKSLSQSDYIRKGIEKWGDIDDFSKLDYKNSRTRVIHICKTHNVEYLQDPHSYLRENGIRGCELCSRENRSKNYKHKQYSKYFTKEEHLQICIENNIYTQVEYKDYRNKNKVLPKKLYGIKYFIENFGSWYDFRNLSPTEIFVNSGMSHGVKKIYKFLHDRNISFKMEKIFNDCKYQNPLPFDFYLEKYNLCIEFDGEYHFVDRSRSRFNKEIEIKDNIKSDYCSKKNINLLRIKHTDDIYDSLTNKFNSIDFPKIKNLDWSNDFNNEGEILSHNLSKNVKIELLLLLRERGLSSLTDKEIMKKLNTNQVYTIKNDLVQNGYIEFNKKDKRGKQYTDVEKSLIFDMYRNGKSPKEIASYFGLSENSGHRNIVDHLKKNGIYKFLNNSPENTKLIKNKINELRDNGFSTEQITDITNKMYFEQTGKQSDTRWMLYK